MKQSSDLKQGYFACSNLYHTEKTCQEYEELGESEGQDKGPDR